MSAIAKALLTMVLSLLLLCEVASNPADETRLREKLFKSHNRNVRSRPVQRQNHTVDVTLHLGIDHIFEVDEKRETLTFNGWMFMLWPDMSVMWDPAEYGGLEALRLPNDLLWKPDLTVINAATVDDSLPFNQDVNLYVYYTGHVYWVPPVTVSVSCALDFKWFPHDEHRCMVEVLSWVYDGSMINISLHWPESNLTYDNYFQPHSEWDLVRAYPTINEGEFGSIYWPSAQFHVHIRRRAPYYYLTVVVPVLAAAIMMLVTFWLPPPSHEKIIIACIDILLLTVMLLQIYWVVPRSGDSVPGILIMCGNLHAMAGAALVLGVVTSLIARFPRPATPFPAWVQLVIHNPVLHTVMFLDPASFSGEAAAVRMTTSAVGENEEQLTEFKTTQSALGNEWYLVACLLDKLAFYGYCLAIVILSLYSFA